MNITEEQELWIGKLTLSYRKGQRDIFLRLQEGIKDLEATEKEVFLIDVLQLFEKVEKEQELLPAEGV